MEQLERLRSDFPDRVVHCGLVAPCERNPGFAPMIIPNPDYGLDIDDMDPFAGLNVNQEELLTAVKVNGAGPPAPTSM